MNHGLILGRFSLRTGRQAVFFTIVNPMDSQDDLENPLRLVTSKKSRHTSSPGNASKILYFGAIWSSLNKEDCNF